MAVRRGESEDLRFEQFRLSKTKSYGSQTRLKCTSLTESDSPRRKRSGRVPHFFSRVCTQYSSTRAGCTVRSNPFHFCTVAEHTKVSDNVEYDTHTSVSSQRLPGLSGGVACNLTTVSCEFSFPTHPHLHDEVREVRGVSPYTFSKRSCRMCCQTRGLPHVPRGAISQDRLPSRPEGNVKHYYPPFPTCSVASS